MGSSNRDYMQDNYDDRSSGPGWAHDIPTTKWLIITTVVVYFFQAMFVHSLRPNHVGKGNFAVHEGNGSRVQLVAQAPLFQMDEPMAFMGEIKISYVEEWFALEAHKVVRGQIWRLVTFVFCHSRHNPWTLIFNMLVLWSFGGTLERMYGSREMLWFYLASALTCGLIFVGFVFFTFLPLPLMGSTCATFAIMTLYATHFPRQEILFMMLVPVEIRVLLALYVAIDVYFILQVVNGQTPLMAAAYLTQIFGVAFGYAYRRFNWHLTGLVEMLDLRGLQRSMRRAAASRRLKVYQPEVSANLNEQVDAILAKIHEQGSESLTERERSILQKASEQAKNRM